MFKLRSFSSYFHFVLISWVIGSAAFGLWYLNYRDTVSMDLARLCIAVRPHLQIGSTRWADDLTRSAIRLSYRELSAKITEPNYTTAVSIHERLLVSRDCQVPGLTPGLFVIEASKGVHFQTWLLTKLLTFFLGALLFSGLITLAYQWLSNRLVSTLTDAMNDHFGIGAQSKYIGTAPTLISRFFGQISILKYPKEAIKSLAENLDTQITLNSQLELALQQRRVFSKYAHDVRSPLSALRIVMSKRRASFNEDETYLLEKSFERIEEMVQSILDQERSALKQGLNFRRPLKLADLVSILELTCSRLQLEFGSSCVITSHYSMTENLTGDLKVTALDLDRLLSNLVINSRNATATAVTIQLRNLDDEIELIVTDNGHGGLKPREQGIGLEIVSDILKRANGAITVHSPRNEGTKITISIPVE